MKIEIKENVLSINGKLRYCPLHYNSPFAMKAGMKCSAYCAWFRISKGKTYVQVICKNTVIQSCDINNFKDFSEEEKTDDKPKEQGKPGGSQEVSGSD